MTVWIKDAPLNKDTTAIAGCAVVGIAVVGSNISCGGCDSPPTLVGGCDSPPTFVGACDTPPPGYMT